MVLVLSVNLHALVVGVRPQHSAYATLVVDGEYRSVVAHGAVGEFGDRRHRIVRVFAAKEVEAVVVDSRTLVRHDAHFQPPMRRRVVVGNSLETVVAEVGKVQTRPVDTVLTLQTYGIHQLRIVYMPSARPLGAYVGVASLIDVEGEWEVEVYLFLLERVARLESELQALALIEEV